MSNVLPFGRSRAGSCGTVHVLPCEGGGFEVSHESASGDSWGCFSSHASPLEAVAAGYALNRDEMRGECDVHVSPAVLALLPAVDRQRIGRGDF